MKKIKGPDLKMPEMKLPRFVTDLYYDLRDRRLLPLVALVLVAIIAVPFLLSSGSQPKPRPVAPGPAITGANVSDLTVVRATPGLRDYRKRLRGRTPTDPFKRPSRPPDLSAAELGTPGNNGFEGSAVTSTTSTTTTSDGATVTKETTKSPAGETTTETKTTETEIRVPGGESGDAGSGGQPSEQVNLYSFAIDVKITRTEEEPESHKKTTKSQTRSEVLPPAPLPGEKEQVVTYMGISPKTRNPLLLVSDAVTSVFGEAKCLSGESKCQLLEVETGIPTTFVYGESGVRVKINVLKVEPVLTGHS